MANSWDNDFCPNCGGTRCSASCYYGNGNNNYEDKPDVDEKPLTKEEQEIENLECMIHNTNYVTYYTLILVIASFLFFLSNYKSFNIVAGFALFIPTGFHIGSWIDIKRIDKKEYLLRFRKETKLSLMMIIAIYIIIIFIGFFL